MICRLPRDHQCCSSTSSRVFSSRSSTFLDAAIPGRQASADAQFFDFLGAGHRQPEGELRAWSVFLVEHELAAHPQRELTTDCQAKPEPSDPCGLPATLKALEDGLPIPECHAGSVVRHAPLGTASLVQLHPNLGSLCAVPA